MIQKLSLTISLLTALTVCSCSTGNKISVTETVDYTSYVDPRIGTGGHGHVFYGANVPYGFVQLGPSSIPQEWDWTSGYHISDSTVIGFPHTHLSGTGIGDLHDVNVMPVVGEVTYARGNHSSYETGLWSYSDRSKEYVSPGYYKTHLLRYGIDVELTATTRVGFHKYTFPAEEEPGVVFDMVNGGGWDMPEEAVIRIVNDSTISGYRYSSGWASFQKIYFAATFSRNFHEIRFIIDGKGTTNLEEGKGKKVFARINFHPSSHPLLLKVALSPTSEDAAFLNMQAELSGWNFEKTVAEAKECWNKELSKIHIQSNDSVSKKNLLYQLIPYDVCSSHIL